MTEEQIEILEAIKEIKEERKMLNGGKMKIKPTELIKLREYFDKNRISYQVAYWEENRYNPHVNLEYVKLSSLTSEGSYGWHNVLIEFYNFRDEPTGHLTADEAIEIYEKEVE